MKIMCLGKIVCVLEATNLTFPISKTDVLMMAGEIDKGINVVN